MHSAGRQTAVGKRRRVWRLLWGALVPGVMGLAGCANFWDEVTARDFDPRSLFNKPNPLVVLARTDDGAMRAKALRALREPAQCGGNAQDQEMVVQVLTVAATTDRQPLCRLAAIKSLGHFKDPRAAEALCKVYQNPKPFPAETSVIIDQQALTALGQTGGPAARDLLVRVAGEPPRTAESSELEKQMALDRRLTAVRALAHFKNYDVTEALVKVLQIEKDVALRDGANESLQVVTGKKLPPDAKAWENVIHPANGGHEDTVAQEPGWKAILGWR